MESETEGLLIEPLEDYQELTSFVSGNKQMDDFIHEYLGECDASHCCQTYDMRIGAAGTGKPSVDAWFRERFEEKAIYPALEIAYLAVSQEAQHLHLGSEILSQIEYMAKTQKMAGCVFLTVNALHTSSYSAVPFYEKNQFAKLTVLPQSDVWPMYKTLWVEEVD